MASFRGCRRPFRDAILGICQRHLAPNGIAFVSYNTLPGWRLRGVIRDLMVYHGGCFPSPKERVEQARAMLQFIARPRTAKSTPYAQFLRQESEFLTKQADSYLFHEHLEDCNEALYFHEFAARLAPQRTALPWRRRLRHHVAVQVSPGGGSRLCARSPRTIASEQYLDFLPTGCSGRPSSAGAVAAELRVGVEPLAGLRVAAPLKPESPKADRHRRSPPVSRRRTANLSTPTRSLKTAFTILCEAWPLSCHSRTCPL